MWSSLVRYHRPSQVSEALRLLARESPRTVPLAGGTWLVARRDPTIEAVVDLTRLNLAFIKLQGDWLHLGAMTRLQSLIAHPEVCALANGLLAEAVRRSAPPPTRNVATLGGTLVIGRPTSEVALALLALDAQVVIRAPTRRMVSLDAFLAHRTEHLPPSGLIVEVFVPLSPPNLGAVTMEISCAPRDRPIVNAAVLVSRQGEVCRVVRLALGGVAPHPLRLPAVEALLTGSTPDDERLVAIAQAVSGTVTPATDTRASAEYRRETAGILAVRALREAWAQTE